MKKIIYFILLLFISFYGCRSHEIQRENNRKNLLKISLGMSKQRVMDIMIDIDSTYLPYHQRVEKGELPYRSETYSQDGKTYEILFYYTDIKSNDGAITDDELTPVIFFDNKVIGWGWKFLGDNTSKYQIQFR